MKKNIFARFRAGSRKSGLRRTWVNFATYGGALIVLITIIALGYRSNVNVTDEQKDSFVVAPTTKPIVNVEAIDDSKAIGYANKIATKTEMAIAPSVSEQAESVKILAAVDQNTTASVVNPTADDVEISSFTSAVTKYIVKDGDDLAMIAAKFDISEQTIKWANNMKDDAVAVGTELSVPVIDGVVYIVKNGDSLASIVEKYKSVQDQIIAVNNLESEIVTTGMQLVLPAGVLPETERPGYIAPRPRPVVSASYANSSSAGGWRAPNAPLAPGNTFYYGNCTWYAYNRRIQMGRRMDGIRGNANAWDDTARAAGYLVNRTPAVGAIIQSDGGRWGHVGVVESINDDGTITISEMNNRAYGGFGVANYNKISNPYDFIYIH